MNRKVVKTKDGSSSLYLPELDEHYHSSHGAVQESRHVFIQNGLTHFKGHEKSIDILEVGFGTGLNAILSLEASVEDDLNIRYTAIEPFPLLLTEVDQLNYEGFVRKDIFDNYFRKMHELGSDKWHILHPGFHLVKYQQKLLDCHLSKTYDLIYYDAFGPRAQNDMWELKALQKAVFQLKKDGIFVTYCVKGSVKRNLKELGMQIEKLPGPPGKREMLNARF